MSWSKYKLECCFIGVASKILEATPGLKADQGSVKVFNGDLRIRTSRLME